MFILNKKLPILKSKLKTWNHELLGNVFNIVKTSGANLDFIKSQIQPFGVTETHKCQEKEAHSILTKALNILKCFWMEKSKVKWKFKGYWNNVVS